MIACHGGVPPTWQILQSATATRPPLCSLLFVLFRASFASCSAFVLDFVSFLRRLPVSPSPSPSSSSRRQTSNFLEIPSPFRLVSSRGKRSPKYVIKDGWIRLTDGRTDGRNTVPRTDRQRHTFPDSGTPFPLMRYERLQPSFFQSRAQTQS